MRVHLLFQIADLVRLLLVLHLDVLRLALGKFKVVLDHFKVCLGLAECLVLLVHLGYYLIAIFVQRAKFSNLLLQPLHFLGVYGRPPCKPVLLLEAKLLLLLACLLKLLLGHLKLHL